MLSTLPATRDADGRGDQQPAAGVAGLDGAEIMIPDGRGPGVTLRCAAYAFVNRGLMNTRALVLDTTDTVIYGNGG
jgi:hypothetical protein